MRLPKYGEYKESGVSFLGSIPTHWEPCVIKRVVSLVESGVSVNAVDEPAGPDSVGVLKTSCVYTNNFDPNENKAVLPEEVGRVACSVKAGTLIVSRMNTPSLVGAAGLVEEDRGNLFLPDRLWQVHLEGVIPRFVHYWTTSPSYRAQVQMACAGTSSSMQNLAQDEFLRFAMPLPAKEEQLNITAFLDRETAKIDALIAEQEKLLTLLAEKRQATISHAVTKGLNPDVPMKDSGVEWLGEVPEHWGHRKKLLDLVTSHRHSFVNGPFGSDLLTSELTYEGVPVVYIRDIKESGYIRVSEWCVTKEKATQLSFCNVLPGDLVVAKVGDPPGMAAIYPEGEPEGVVTQDVIRLRLDSAKSYAGYVRWVLNSNYGQTAIDQISVESTRTRVGLGEYKQLRFFIPPVHEQREISDFLDNEIRRLNALASKASSAIDLLKERRAALISAAVTGQIDVRNAIPEPVTA